MRNEKGFTLLEIISVLVILGVLSAVAIPRYMDLQNEAKLMSAQGALAAGGSNAYMVYSKMIMCANNPSGCTGITAAESPIAPTAAEIITNLNVDLYKKVGDFAVNYKAGTLSNCATAIVVIFSAGPPAGTDTGYITGGETAQPSKTFCIY